MSERKLKFLVGGGVVGVLVLIVGLVIWITCVPSYNVPKFVEIEPHQTAFLLPMDWDDQGDAQQKFDSVEFLKKKKVAGRRVQVPRKWVQMGRMPSTGEYMDTVKVLLVDRTPVVREWQDDAGRGTSVNNDSIDVTSKDGIAFSFAFTVTANISEEDTATYLYNYRSKDLAAVVDNEIRARVQSVATNYCTQQTMDVLRGQQNEIIKSMVLDMEQYYKERGITLSNLGIIGRFKYQNEEVQKAVDAIFVAQQQEDVNIAKEKAQSKENDRLKLEAEGKAVAAKIEATGKADAAREEATGKAEAIKSMADAKSYELEKATKDKDFYMELLKFDIERKRLEIWDGKYPLYYMIGNGDKNTLLIPTPKITEDKK